MIASGKHRFRPVLASDKEDLPIGTKFMVPDSDNIYKIVPSDTPKSCFKCSFCAGCTGKIVPECSPYHRSDSTGVIFVEI